MKNMIISYIGRLVILYYLLSLHLFDSKAHLTQNLIEEQSSSKTLTKLSNIIDSHRTNLSQEIYHHSHDTQAIHSMSDKRKVIGNSNVL